MRANGFNFFSKNAYLAGNGELSRIFQPSCPNPNNQITSFPFPSFSWCPPEDDIDERYYNTGNGYSYGPYRHWCLLAEVVQVESFIRLRLNVRDWKGEEFFVAFYPEESTEQPPAGQFKIGHTVAILYPHQHQFLDGSLGIRQELSKSIQVSGIPSGVPTHYV